MTDVTMCQIIHRCQYIAIGLHRASGVYLGRKEHIVNALKELNLNAVGTFEKTFYRMRGLGTCVLQENMGSDLIRRVGCGWRWWASEVGKTTREKNELWERKQVAFTKGIWQD